MAAASQNTDARGKRRCLRPTGERRNKRGDLSKTDFRVELSRDGQDNSQSGKDKIPRTRAVSAPLLCCNPSPLTGLIALVLSCRNDIETQNQFRFNIDGSLKLLTEIIRKYDRSCKDFVQLCSLKCLSSSYLSTTSETQKMEGNNGTAVAKSQVVGYDIITEVLAGSLFDATRGYCGAGVEKFMDATVNRLRWRLRETIDITMRSLCSVISNRTNDKSSSDHAVSDIVISSPVSAQIVESASIILRRHIDSPTTSGISMEDFMWWEYIVALCLRLLALLCGYFSLCSHDGITKNVEANVFRSLSDNGALLSLVKISLSTRADLSLSTEQDWQINRDPKDQPNSAIIDVKSKVLLCHIFGRISIFLRDAKTTKKTKTALILIIKAAVNAGMLSACLHSLSAPESIEIKSCVRCSMAFLTCACEAVDQKSRVDITYRVRNKGSRGALLSRRTLGGRQSVRIRRSRGDKAGPYDPFSLTAADGALCSLSSYVDTIIASGCLPAILWHFVSNCILLSDHSTQLMEALINHEFGKGLSTSQLIITLVEQGCTPILFGIREKYRSLRSSKQFQLTDSLIQAISAACFSPSDISGKGDISSGAEGLPRSLSLLETGGGCIALKSHLCSAVIFIDAECKRRDFEKGEMKLDNKGATKNSSWSALMDVLLILMRGGCERDIRQAKLVLLTAKVLLSLSGPMSHADFGRKSLCNGSNYVKITVENHHDFESSANIDIWVKSNDKPSRVKMQCPPFQEISKAAPLLAKQVS